MRKLEVISVGGTLDKVYFDAKSEYQVGEPVVGEVLEAAGVTLPFTVTSLFKLDSLDMNDEHRRQIVTAVQSSVAPYLLITHGTDTMVETGLALVKAIEESRIENKTVVITGALSPARFKNSDAAFNIGCAVGAVQSLPAGVYIAMNGQVLRPERARKNRERGCFEAV